MCWGVMDFFSVLLSVDFSRYGSAAEFAKIIDGVTEAEVPRGTFPRTVWDELGWGSYPSSLAVEQ